MLGWLAGEVMAVAPAVIDSELEGLLWRVVCW